MAWLAHTACVHHLSLHIEAIWEDDSSVRMLTYVNSRCFVEPVVIIDGNSRGGRLPGANTGARRSACQPVAKLLHSHVVQCSAVQCSAVQCTAVQ